MTEAQKPLVYARYTFSYKSLLPEAQGARAMFEGVAIMRLRDGLIAEYSEVANVGTGFVDMSFAPERIARILGRQASALKGRPEMAAHLLSPAAAPPSPRSRAAPRARPGG